MPRQKKTKPDDTEQFALFQLPEVPNAFKKAVQVVHSTPRAPMSLLQRKLSNAWLKNAVDNPPDDQGWWTISTSAMQVDIGFDSNNREYLINSSLELMRIVFEWDVLAPDAKKAKWKASVLFPEVEVRSDVIRYQISSQLKDRVLMPDMYALIDLNIIKRFRRASSIAIYEFCIRFERIGRTAEVKWEMFRDIVMGESSESKSYQQYKVFKDKVLKPAVAEVNTQSDIQITLQESYLGRRVDKLSFQVTRAKADEPEKIVDDQMLQDIAELVKFGIPQSEAKKLAARYGHPELNAAIELTRKRINDKKASKIENPAAYLRMAIQNGWAIVEAQTSTPKRKEAAASVESLYMAEQVREAERYFKELDMEDQEGLIKRYNEQQEVSVLQIRKKPAKGALTAFYMWVAIDTWGRPSADSLLKFAQELLSKAS